MGPKPYAPSIAQRGLFGILRKQKSRLRKGFTTALGEVEWGVHCPIMGRKPHESGREKGRVVTGGRRLCCPAGDCCVSLCGPDRCAQEEGAANARADLG